MSENTSSEKLKSKVAEDFKEFCTTISAHGFSYLATSSRTKKIAWLTILVIAFVLGVTHLYFLISQYLNYDYHESMFVDNTETPVFPDVTFCDTTSISDYSMER